MDIIYKVCICLFGAFSAIFLAKKWGSCAEKNKALKKELERTQKEQEYERKVNNFVDCASTNDLRDWLQNDKK